MQDPDREGLLGLTPEPPDDIVDTPLERLELLAGDDAAISDFLDELEVRGPREREMMTELARTTTLADPESFFSAHTRVIGALESLSRHGYVGTSAADHLGPLRFPVRYLIQLVARYIVVSYLRRTATSMRNLYWLRELESPGNSRELKLLRPARMDAQTLETVFAGRAIGVPAFVIGGVLIPLTLSIWNISSRVAVTNWWVAALGGVVSALMVLGISWVLLRGAAMANRRIRLAAEAPLEALWSTVGNCGRPPRNQSRKFVFVGILLSVAAWIVVPVLILIALTA